jgi:hypothetical protein
MRERGAYALSSTIMAALNSCARCIGSHTKRNQAVTHEDADGDSGLKTMRPSDITGAGEFDPPPPPDTLLTGEKIKAAGLMRAAAVAAGAREKRLTQGVCVGDAVRPPIVYN